jgi:hypothetical protein
VPVKEKKKERRSKIMRKLGRSKTESVTSQEQRAPGLVGLLEIMRAQLEARNNIHLYFFPVFLVYLANYIDKVTNSSSNLWYLHDK